MKHHETLQQTFTNLHQDSLGTTTPPTSRAFKNAKHLRPTHPWASRANMQTGKASAVMGAGSKAPGVAPIITGSAIM